MEQGSSSPVVLPKRKTVNTPYYTAQRSDRESSLEKEHQEKKEHQEEKGEKEEEEEEENDNLWIVILFFMLILIILSSGVTLYFSESILRKLKGTTHAEWQVHNIHPNRINTESVEAFSNTTTPEELWRVRRALAIHLSDYPGRYPCLCMHHLKDLKNMNLVRACAVYNPRTLSLEFMINPRLIGWDKGRGVQEIYEKSISCSYTGTAKRANTAFIEWENHESITHYMGFKDQTAYCLQLAMEEFKGNAHCQHDKKK